MPTPGKFISFEGPEACGKSTQVQVLATQLEAQGIPYLVTREPGGTPTGELIREILQHDRSGEPISPEAEVLLFAASRAQHIEHKIRPALEKGTWVLCDRFIDSTSAYQGFGRNFDVDRLIDINTFAIQGIMPDRTLLFDLDVEVAFERLHARSAGSGGSADRFEREDRAFHQRVRAGYLELARREPQRFCVLDAARSREAIAVEVSTCLADWIKEWQA